MGRPVEDLELILARWVLGDIAPENVPALATDALVDGCGASSVAVLAGLSRPTGSEIEEQLPALLRELGVTLPSERDAVKVAVDGLAREIVSGTVPPAAGAAGMASYVRTFQDDDTIWDQLAVFYGLAIELDEENRPSSVLDPEIVDATSTLLAAGVLRTD